MMRDMERDKRESLARPNVVNRDRLLMIRVRIPEFVTDEKALAQIVYTLNRYTVVGVTGIPFVG